MAIDQILMFNSQSKVPVGFSGLFESVRAGHVSQPKHDSSGLLLGFDAMKNRPSAMRSQDRLFGQLLWDRSGNVGLIAAASIIPLMALIGGGIDMSRGYLARTQLQAACDSGALAGRRAMSKSGQFGQPEMDKANALFNANFDAKLLNAQDVRFETSANEQGQVQGAASASVPTLLMRIFGNETIEIETTCMAELQLANADVMFVLDTTGSMAGSRITGLRDAVRDFHKTINQAVTDSNTRVRYGFVPYSMTVNAKNLFNDPDAPMQRDWFVDSAPYQSREAQFNTPVYVATTSAPSTTTETYATTLTSSNCTKYAANNYPSSGTNPSSSGSAPGNVTTRTYAFVSWTGGTSSKKYCTRSVTTRLTTHQTKFAFTNWRYKEVDLDTSEFKQGSTVAVGTSVVTAGAGSVIDPAVHSYADQAGYYDMVTMAKKNGSELHNIGLTNTTWNGCIEERDTVDAANWNPIPDDAYDLDLDHVPDSDETRWRPMWNQLSYSRSHQQHVDTTNNYSPAYYACPSPMMPFTEVELSADPNDVPAWLNTYLGALTPTGNTYHDIGMIWGGRLASSNGPFEANVNKDDKPVSRHLIFMSDGQMEPYIWGYDAYGIEALSNRVAPFNSTTNEVRDRHTARYLAACEAIKAKGITVWVIAFGTALSNEMRACSSDGRAYSASDTTALRNQFKFIASQVANLRLGE